MSVQAFYANQVLSLKVKHPILVIQTTRALHLNIQKYYISEARQTVALCEEQNEFKVTNMEKSSLVILL